MKIFFCIVYRFFTVDDVLSTDIWTFILLSISGVTEHKIPVLDPMFMEELRVNAKNIISTLRHARATGIKDTSLQSVR
jgi:hypothetical protein